MTSNWTWTLNCQNYPVYTKYLHHLEAQILVRFALRLAVTEIQNVQGQRKSEMHWMTPNWAWRLNSQKYSIYTKYLPLRSKCWFVLLYDQLFSKISHILSFPIDYHLEHLKRRTKKKKKCQHIQNLKFHNSLSNFGRDSSQEYAWFFGSESGVYFQRGCCWKFLLPYGPMLNRKKKI